MSGPRHFDHGQWQCRDCEWTSTRAVTNYVEAERHSAQLGHAMTYVDAGSYQRSTTS